jgi:hypothetical protein
MTGEGKQREKRGREGRGGKNRSFFQSLPVKINLTNY